MNLLFGHSTDVYEATLEGDVAMAAGGVSMWGYMWRQAVMWPKPYAGTLGTSLDVASVILQHRKDHGPNTYFSVFRAQARGVFSRRTFGCVHWRGGEIFGNGG